MVYTSSVLKCFLTGFEETLHWYQTEKVTLSLIQGLLALAPWTHLFAPSTPASPGPTVLTKGSGCSHVGLSAFPGH